MIRAEIWRAFTGLPFLAAVGVGLLLCLAQTATVALPYGLGDEWSMLQSGWKGAYPSSVLNSWIGATPYSVWSALFFFAAPLLACIPHAGTLYSDLKSGLAANAVARCGTKRYMAAKGASVFLSAGTAVTAPLVANLAATAMLLPALAPEPSAGTFFTTSSSMLAGCFYSAPWLYVIFYLLFDFVVCGLIACSCLLFAFVASNKFVATVAPFILCVIAYFALGDAQGYCPINLMNPAQPYTAQAAPAAAGCIAAAVAMALFGAWRAHRLEVL